jgi:hypothetical protein
MTNSGTTQVTSAQASAGKQFTFNPPPADFVRTEKRDFALGIVGTPLSRREERELKWKVGVAPSSDGYLMKQQLTHILMKRNGETLIDADVPEGAISADLVIDKAGNLKDVRGLKDTSKTLTAIKEWKKPMDPLETRSVSPEALKVLIAQRYDALTGNLIGHPAEPGSTWTVPGRPMSRIASTTITVQHIEPCSGASCAKLNEDMKLDTEVVRAQADDLIKRRVKDFGGDTSKIETKNAMYSMSGTLLVEPATMLNHDANLEESGTISLRAGNHDIEVSVAGRTDVTYDYSPGARAER